MNMQEKIEKFLKAVPRPPVPETLFDKLKRDIPVRIVQERRGIIRKYFATTGGAISRWRVAAIVGIMALLPLSYGATKLIKRFIAISQLPTIKVDFPYGGALSPDGKQFAGITWNGQLAIIDTSNGQQRNLVENCWESNVVWSANGNEIAVNSYEKEKQILMAISLKTGKIRTLMEDPPRIKDWSPDGKFILAVRTTKVSVHSAVMVNLENKEETVLAKETGEWPSPRFSPNGDSLSYVTEEANQTILHLRKVDGTSHVKYADFHGEISQPLWSPDGSYIVFTGTQKGINRLYKDLWALRVQGNKFVGEPFPVVPDVEQMEFYNWSQNGQLAYRTGFALGRIFSLPVDLQTGKATGAPRQLVRRAGFSANHCWSPDGKQIAVRDGCGLYFISASTGENERILSLPDIEGELGFYGRGMSWSPDGRSIAFSGWDRKKRMGIFLIRIETGDVKLLVPLVGIAPIFDPSWSPDSKTIAYGYEGHVYVVKIENGEPRRITPPSDKQRKPLRPVFAPDGRSIAYIVGQKILATTIDGRETREILHLENEKQTINIFDWSPDGHHIVFTPGNNEIWCAPTDGGEPFRIGDISNMGGKAWAWAPKWSPKGDTIIFTVNCEKYQYWVMENFLPAE
jgi:Tol biopolymer transport system component